MNKMLRITTTLAFLSWVTIVPSYNQNDREPVFHSAKLLSAGSIKIPFNSVAVGIVELRATIGQTGKVLEVKVVRELPSVTEESIRAVKSWEFAPATLDAKALTSQLTVAIAFCSYAGASPIPLPPLETESTGEASSPDLRTVPPEIIAAEFPTVPNTGSVSGTIVLQVDVGPDGKQGLIKVVQGSAPMTGVALHALEDWKFEAGSLGGRKVRSGIVVAFAYRAPGVGY